MNDSFNRFVFRMLGIIKDAVYSVAIYYSDAISRAAMIIFGRSFMTRRNRGVPVRVFLDRFFIWWTFSESFHYIQSITANVLADIKP